MKTKAWYIRLSPLGIFSSWWSWLITSFLFLILFLPLTAAVSRTEEGSMGPGGLILLSAGAITLTAAFFVLAIRAIAKPVPKPVAQPSMVAGVALYPPDSGDAQAFMVLWHDRVAAALGKPFYWEEPGGHSWATMGTAAALNFAGGGRRASGLGGAVAKAGARSAAGMIHDGAMALVPRYLDPVAIVDNGGTSIDVWFASTQMDQRTLHQSAARVAELLNVESVEVRSDPSRQVNGWKIMMESATSKAFSLATPYAPPSQDWKVQIGVQADGSPQVLSLANNSGWVVGGQPGSGKSGFAFSILGSLIQSSAVSLAVLDGKGGDDYSSYKDRAFLNLSTDSLTAAVKAFRLITHEMNWRLQGGISSTLGNPNIWTAGPRPEMPIIWFIVDESQTFYAANSSDSKEVKALKAEITGMAINLVKKGRSAGIILASMTQKISSSSIPTDLSTQCAVRVAFRTSDAMTTAQILGDKPGLQPEGDSPHYLSAEDKGLAYLSDGEKWSKFRVPWVDSDTDQYKRLVAETSRFVNFQEPIHVDAEWAMNTNVAEASATREVDLELNIAGYSKPVPAPEPVRPPAAPTPPVPPTPTVQRPAEQPPAQDMTPEELWRLENGL